MNVMLTQVIEKGNVSGSKGEIFVYYNCNKNLKFLVRIKHTEVVFWPNNHSGLCMNTLKICELKVLKFSLGQCG